MGNRISGYCTNCGVYRESLHRDHIVPKFRGGADDSDNIQLLCANCHEDKTREELTGRKLGPHTEEHRARIGASNAGKKRGPQTEEWIERRISPLRGRKRGPMSEEQKAKLRSATTGMKHTPEAKAKMSEAQRRIWASRDQATKDRIVGAMNGVADFASEGVPDGND